MKKGNLLTIKSLTPIGGPSPPPTPSQTPKPFNPSTQQNGNTILNATRTENLQKCNLTLSSISLFQLNRSGRYSSRICLLSYRHVRRRLKPP